MNRKEAIEIIETLYPPDADRLETAAKGRELLSRAKREVSYWKKLPTEVLIRLAELNEEEDNKDV